MKLETINYLRKYYGLSNTDEDPITQLEGYFHLARKKNLFPISKCDCGRYSDARLNRCPFCDDDEEADATDYELKTEELSPEDLSEIYKSHPQFEFSALEQKIREHLLEINDLYKKVAECLWQINDRDLWKIENKHDKTAVYKSSLDWAKRVFSIPTEIGWKMLRDQKWTRGQKYFQLGPLFSGNYWNAVDVVENKLKGTIAFMPISLGMKFYDVKRENDCDVFEIEFGDMIIGRVCVFSRRDGSKAATFRMRLNDERKNKNYH